MKERTFAAQEYTYGFNGMEKDDEMNGEGNSYMTQYRQYNSRLGKWLSLDPKMTKYPHQSPYAAFNDNPIFFTDPFGDDPPERLSRWKRLGNWSRGEMYKNKANKYASQNDIDAAFIKAEDNEIKIIEFTGESKQNPLGGIDVTEYRKVTTFRKGQESSTETALWATAGVLAYPKPYNAIPWTNVEKIGAGVVAAVATGYYVWNMSDVDTDVDVRPYSLPRDDVDDDAQNLRGALHYNNHDESGGGHAWIGISVPVGAPPIWYHLDVGPGATSTDRIGNFVLLPITERLKYEALGTSSYVSKTMTLDNTARAVAALTIKTSAPTFPYAARSRNCATECADVMRAAGFPIPADRISGKYPKFLRIEFQALSNQ
jgi:RHS repeat-associated protein